MCLALAGDGIRPAMYFGEASGGIIRRGLEIGLPVEDGREKHAAFVRSHQPFFDFFTVAQAFLTRLPAAMIDLIARVVSRDLIRPRMFDAYWGLTRSWDDGCRGLHCIWR